MIQVLLVLHVVFAVLWFAAPLSAVPMLRRVAPHGREAFHAVALSATRQGVVGAVGNVCTFLSGVGLMFAVYGGMSAPVRFHVALGLVLLAGVLGFLVQRPAGQRLAQLATDPDWTPEKTAGQVKRLAMGVRAQQTLWLGCLIAMFAR